MSPKLMNLCNTWLEPIRAQLPSELTKSDADSFQEALNQEAMRRVGNFLAGIRAYQDFPAVRKVAPEISAIWEKGTTRLLDYAPASQGPVLLVVPSLVNRFDILDLDEDRSFLRFLADSGFHPLVVDWGVPGQEENNFSIADYMTKRLMPILAFATIQQKGESVHLVGYCMGGLMALALALMAPLAVKSLTLLATPWDFSEGVGGVPGCSTPTGKLFMKEALRVENCLEKIGFLPASFLQSVFTNFQPLGILQKFAGFSNAESESKAARYFVLTEDWLNDGVPLALPVAQECLCDWYGQNVTMNNRWKIGDLVIDPSQIKVPTFILSAKNDKIVPPSSSLPLAKLMPHATLLAPDMGHIGLMVSAQALEKVWLPLVHWLKALGR